MKSEKNSKKKKVSPWQYRFEAEAATKKELR